MGGLHPSKSIITLFILLHLNASSSVDIQQVIPRHSFLTIYLIPFDNTTNIDVNMTISLYDQSLTQEMSIYSTTAVMSEKRKYSVWNFNGVDQTIYIKLASDAKIPRNMVRIEPPKKDPVFVAALDKDTSSGYMLPFNMVSLKTFSIYVIAYEQPIKFKQYNLEPFTSTYWRERNSNIVLIPHLPFFSQCSYQKPYILINDLLEPENCQLYDLFGLRCDSKQINFQCVLEELKVNNVDAEYWFNNDQSILYYLFPNKFPLRDLYWARGNLSGVKSLILTQFDNLVPVYYSRHSTDRVIVNDFHILLKVAFSEDSAMQMHIVYAEIKGKFNPNLPIPTAQVHVNVRYLDIFERFNAFDSEWIWYIAFGVILGCCMASFIWFIVSRFGKMRIQEKMKHVLAPALKGCFYTLATGGFFFVVVNQIGYRTNYGSISSLFDGVLEDEQLQMNNIGRNGLAVAVTGFYLMTAALKQACKIHSEWQLKIHFEDDSRLQKRRAMSEQQLAERIQFTRKNMVSHQKFILICNLVVIMIVTWYSEFLLSLQNMETAIAMVLLTPIMSKIFAEKMKHFIIKQLLYICGNLMSLILTSILVILQCRTVGEFVYLYFSRFVNIYIELILMEMYYGNVLLKLDENSQRNILTKFLSKLFQGSIQFKRKQSEYERAIYLSSLIVVQVIGVILLPLTCLVIFLLSRTTLLQSQMLMGHKSSGYSLLMLVSMAPMQLVAIFAILQVMKRQGVRVQQVIKFNRFRFKRRKFRWMNDQFSLSRNIHFFYRQYDKFAFSSQLYFVVSLLGFSAFLLYLGILIVIQSSYMLGNDPIVLIILLIVFVSGDILSFVVSFAALKLRLYQKKEEEVMRQSLLKTQKYLKNNDITDFLQLQGVKDYFLLYNSEWIVHNLPRIFDKDDFQDNAGQLVSKYKQYKSIFKKRQMDEKRRLRLKQNSVISNESLSLQQKQIALPKAIYKEKVQPMMYYWFYLARQNLYLKSIVASVRRDKLRKNCEFCNMDVQLQALQRRDFQQLVNEFRLLNVNRPFDSKSYLEFYRLRQKYVTICAECKDKNLHMENKITMKENASKIVKRWHMIAKSFILHRQQNQDHKGQK